MARVLAKEAKIGKMKDKKENNEKRVSEAKKGLWNLARNKALQDRGALPQEEGVTPSESSRHCTKEISMNSWFREDKERRKR